jgi:hypothetical protein
MTTAEQQMTERELLLLLRRDIADLNQRLQIFERRLETGAEHFSVLDRRVDAVERGIAQARADMQAAILNTQRDVHDIRDLVMNGVGRDGKVEERVGLLERRNTERDAQERLVRVFQPIAIAVITAIVIGLVMTALGLQP